MKIAICDDEQTLCETLRQKIERHCKNSGITCQIYAFNSGNELLSLPEEKIPDILFLDIQMPGKNGMQTAKELRSQNRDMILIFVTALSEYVYEAFDVNAFHYLVKPFEDEKLQEVLDRALQQCEKQAEDPVKTDYREKTAKTEKQAPPRAILVKQGGLSTKVLLSDIVYAEVFNRKIMLHTINGDIEYYGKLTDLSEQTGADFYRTHRAYLVNLKYVEKYNATTVWLKTDAIPVSKKQFAGFVRQYMRYISRTSGRRADR
ncbi:MAG: LytTR family DNA-binding domain-containing protein [Lachnospiraceae bacterium]|nr:LytTR family DNA-binding domain-containing protein [Lachnospiraceae bacterium]